MAGTAGLEPVTFCVTGRRSNQLSYAPSLTQEYYNTRPEKSIANIDKTHPKCYFTYACIQARRGAGAVERGSLENYCGCKVTVGSNPTLSAKIEGGVVIKPSVQTVAKIAKALGVSIEILLK